MTARVLPFTSRLSPEAPVRRDMTLYTASYVNLMVHLAVNLPDPSPSELIDQLTHATDPAERAALAEIIRSTAP